MKAPFSSLCATALGLLALTPSVLAAKPSTGCGKAPKLVTGTSTTELTFTSGGKARTYYVNLPANYNNTHPYRFIYTLHALGGTAAQVIAGTGGYVPWYGLPALISDNTGAIYVAPNGQSNGWANTGGSDATFLTELLHALEADLCVDLNLVFSTGFSYGAAMSYSLACSLGSELRAVAVLSGNPQISGCGGNASQPVAYYGEHGVSDTVLPITGGRQMRDRFVKNNGCTAQTPAEPAAGSGTHIKTQYKGCDKYPVTWVAFDGPHTPQPMDKGQSKSFAPNETYEFFMQFT